MAAAAVVLAIAIGALPGRVDGPLPPKEASPSRPAPLSATVSLQRVTNGREEPVPVGGTVRPGDQLSMLVINEFAVAPDTSLPVSVKWRFPKEANLLAVAYESQGNLFNSQFESSAEQGDWQTITLTVNTYDTYRVEYYQPLGREGSLRSFTLKWIGDYGEAICA